MEMLVFLSTHFVAGVDCAFSLIQLCFFALCVTLVSGNNLDLLIDPFEVFLPSIAHVRF